MQTFVEIIKLLQQQQYQQATCLVKQLTEVRFVVEMHDYPFMDHASKGYYLDLVEKVIDQRLPNYHKAVSLLRIHHQDNVIPMRSERCSY